MAVNLCGPVVTPVQVELNGLARSSPNFWPSTKNPTLVIAPDAAKATAEIGMALVFRKKDPSAGEVMVTPGFKMVTLTTAEVRTWLALSVMTEKKLWPPTGESLTTMLWGARESEPMRRPPR